MKTYENGISKRISLSSHVSAIFSFKFLLLFCLYPAASNRSIFAHARLKPAKLIT